ncbi:hypothetical protein G7Y89_g93 [Cudoniella acicularis]|uniref:Uncharacterized protein n=1 Tax=Cudoniella acicularis TaxID=354080 RepID=A0A8H4RYQ9_9HELO|nr:hypothetical protein G7Y89_g93 [Cudoniella acicularis]
MARFNSASDPHTRDWMKNYERQMPRNSLGIDLSIKTIVVLDLGTARLGGVYWMRDTDREQEIENWGDHGIDNGSLAATCMYYLPGNRRGDWNERRFIWGAEVEQERIMAGDEFDVNRLVEYWKPGLHKTEGTNKYHECLQQKCRYIFGNNNPLGIRKFAFDFLDATLDFLLNPETGYFVQKLGTSKTFDTAGVSVVMTMPSGWPEHEYAIFRQAADKYSLHSLTMLPESDSMARSWLRGGGMRSWRDFKIGAIFITLDWGAGTIVVSVLNEDGKKSLGLKHILRSMSLNHGFETSVRRFEEKLRSRLSQRGHSAEELPGMTKAAEYQFRRRTHLFDFKTPGPKALSMQSRRDGRFNLQLTEDELKRPFQPALHAVTEAIKGIKSTLATKGYDAPTVPPPYKVGEQLYKLNRGQAIHMGGGASYFSYLSGSIRELFSKELEVTIALDSKKCVCWGAYDESRINTVWTRRKVSRWSCAIPYKIPCLKSGSNEDPSEEEKAMLSLNPEAVKVENKDLKTWEFQEPVNDWFIKVGDPITAELNLDDLDNYRIRVVKCLDDLSFYEYMTVSLEYPGDDRFTLLDPQNENVLKIEIDVKGRFQHHKDLPRANDKKKTYKTRQLMYFYTTALDPTDSDTTLLFFNYFVPKTQAWEKFQVQALKIDASNYSSHGNMDESATESVSIPSMPSLTSIEEITGSSWEAADQLKKEREQSTAKANESFRRTGEQVANASQFSLPGQSTLSPVPKDCIDQMWSEVQTQSVIPSTAILASEAAKASRVRSLRSTQTTPAAQQKSQGLGFSSSPIPTEIQLENIITSTSLPVGGSKRSGLVRPAHDIEAVPVAMPIRRQTRPAPVANSSITQLDATGFNGKENRKLAAKSNGKANVSALPLPSTRKPLAKISTASTSNIVRQA